MLPSPIGTTDPVTRPSTATPPSQRTTHDKPRRPTHLEPLVDDVGRLTFAGNVAARRQPDAEPERRRSGRRILLDVAGEHPGMGRAVGVGEDRDTDPVGEPRSSARFGTGARDRLRTHVEVGRSRSPSRPSGPGHRPGRPRSARPRPASEPASTTSPRSGGPPVKRHRVAVDHQRQQAGTAFLHDAPVGDPAERPHHPRAPDRGMTGERQLGRRREDPQPVVGASRRTTRRPETRSPRG